MRVAGLEHTRMMKSWQLVVLLAMIVSPRTALSDISNIEHVRHDRDLLSVQIPTWVAGAAGDQNAVEPYYDSAGRVVRLSSTENVTFRLSPATAWENFDQGDYDRALAKYPSVRDCLVDGEREKVNPDLTQFDWVNMPNHGAAYACFVLIFTSYEMASDVMWWMARQRMWLKRSYAKYRFGRPAKSIRELELSKDFALVLSGGFSELPYGGSKNPWPLSKLESKGYTVSARFSKVRGLVSINIIAHRVK